MSVNGQTKFDPYHVWLGIPRSEQPPTFYRLLGIAKFEANAEVIASAADRQMAHLRTFQVGKYSEQSQQLLNEVANAKVKLLKPAAKEAYDAKLRQSVEKANLTAAVSVQPKPSGKTSLPKQTAVPRSSQQFVPEQPKQPAHAPLAPVQLVDAPPPANEEFEFVSAPDEHPKTSYRRKRPSSTPGPAFVVQTMISCGFLAVAGFVGYRMMLKTTAPEHKNAPSPVAKNTAAEAQHPQLLNIPNARNVGSNRTSPPIEKIVALTTDTKNADTPVALPPGKLEPNPPTTSSRPEFVAPTQQPKTATVPESFPEFIEATHVNDTSATNIASEVPAKRNAGPLPEKVAQKLARNKLATVFNTQLAKTPLEKLKLANQLLEASNDDSGDPAEIYVMLDEASQLAVQAGDAELAIQLIQALSERFQIDAKARKEAILIELCETAKSSERLRSLTIASQAVLQKSLDANRYEQAATLATAVARACQRPGGKDFRKEAMRWRTVVQSLHKEKSEFDAAMLVLRDKPDDEAANLLVGKHHCFKSQEWEQGLPFLAKCSDKELKAIAKEEVAQPPTDTDQQTALADRWWQLGKSRKGEEQDALLLRAGRWYQEISKTEQVGLAKLKVDSRLEELLDVKKRQEELFASRGLGKPVTEASLWSDTK